MTQNIFTTLLGREPKFGDRFKAKDGQMIIYLNYTKSIYQDFWEEKAKCPHFCINTDTNPRHYRDDGTNWNDHDNETIVGLWKEPIDDKNIDDRAEKYASVLSKDLQHFAEECYMAGATEQRAIDIEKAKQFATKWFDEIADLWLPELRNEPYRTQAMESIFVKLEKSMKQ